MPITPPRPIRPQRSLRIRGFALRNEAQSLVEVAIFLPIFTLLVCYAVDFGYFFLASTTMISAAREASQYAIQGPQSASQAAVPAAGPDTTLGTVANLVEGAIGLPRAATATTVQVCSNGVTGSPAAGNIAKCQTWGANTSLVFTADLDPESPTFQLNRVDVVYTVSAPVPMPAAILPSLTFHRFVELRAMQ
ncbi:MAG TPA: TadE/TadG family type IV pilus assembly protein [Acidisarcina sp.]